MNICFPVFSWYWILLRSKAELRAELRERDYDAEVAAKEAGLIILSILPMQCNLSLSRRDKSRSASSLEIVIRVDLAKSGVIKGNLAGAPLPAIYIYQRLRTISDSTCLPAGIGCVYAYVLLPHKTLLQTVLYCAAVQGVCAIQAMQSW